MFRKSIFLPWFGSVAILCVWTMCGDAQTQSKGAGTTGTPKASGTPKTGGTSKSGTGNTGTGNTGTGNTGASNPGTGNPGTVSHPAPRIGRDYQGQVDRNMAESFRNKMYTEAMVSASIRPNPSLIGNPLVDPYGRPWGNSFGSSFGSPFNSSFNSPFNN